MNRPYDAVNIRDLSAFFGLKIRRGGFILRG
jgi:hypothetical protein